MKTNEKEYSSFDVVKAVTVAFVVGVIVGMILIGFIWFVVELSYDADKYEPTATEVLCELEYLRDTIRDINEVSKKSYGLAGNTRDIIQDCIYFIREEVNDYNAVLAKEMGK